MSQASTSVQHSLRKQSFYIGTFSKLYCFIAVLMFCIFIQRENLCVPGAVNVHYFAWKFLRAMYQFPFLHSKTGSPSLKASGRTLVCIMTFFSDEIAVRRSVLYQSRFFFLLSFYLPVCNAPKSNFGQLKSKITLSAGF